MNAGLRRAAPRDQAPSRFTAILERAVAHVAGARAAALVDWEGETVDYAGRLAPFEVKVAAANLSIVLATVRERARLGEVRQLRIRTARQSFLVRRLEEGYALVLLFGARAAFVASERALVECEHRLREEAGWRAPVGGARWYAVEVEVESEPRGGGRPSRLRAGGAWRPLEVIGHIVGLGPRERGFRVRIQGGAEMLLVREWPGLWYADERLDG